jgi:hypothetical protein
MVFDRFTGPLRFEDLVGMFVHLWGVMAIRRHPAEFAVHAPADRGYRMELQGWLTELWAQIRELPAHSVWPC